LVSALVSSIRLSRNNNSLLRLATEPSEAKQKKTPNEWENERKTIK
jgi:hypothetical protein